MLSCCFSLLNLVPDKILNSTKSFPIIFILSFTGLLIGKLPVYSEDILPCATAPKFAKVRQSPPASKRQFKDKDFSQCSPHLGNILRVSEDARRVHSVEENFLDVYLRFFVVKNNFKISLKISNILFVFGMTPKHAP